MPLGRGVLTPRAVCRFLSVFASLPCPDVSWSYLPALPAPRSPAENTKCARSSGVARRSVVASPAVGRVAAPSVWSRWSRRDDAVPFRRAQREWGRMAVGDKKKNGV